MSNIIQVISRMTAQGASPKAINRTIARSGMRLGVAGRLSLRSSKRSVEPAVDSSDSGMGSSASKSASDESAAASSATDRKAKKKAKKAKAERTAARVALAAAALVHARAARERRPDRARSSHKASPMLAKLGVDGGMLKRHAARETLQGIETDADASAVRFFARRGVDERTARSQAKAFTMDLVAYRNLVERGERLERTG